MINALGDDIRFTDRYRTKYDSAMAEWLDSGPEPDESTGSVEWHGHVSRFGKRLLHEDDRGFVSVERFDTEAEAIDRFETIDAEYGAWLDDDEPEDDEPMTDDEPEPDDEPEGWVHAPARDGAGCSWCGTWAMVNGDGMCRECFEADDEPAPVEHSGIICHDGTAVNLSLGVPGCLQATPIPGSRFNDWVTSHNRALDDYRHNRARRNETAVLSLAAGILQYCASHDSMGTGDDVDWYGAEHVLVPLLDGFENALNFDLGRLDGGTLSGFGHAVRNSYAGGLGA